MLKHCGNAINQEKVCRMRLRQIENIADSPEWLELWQRDSFQHPWYLPGQLRVAQARPPSGYYLPEAFRVGFEQTDNRECRPLGLLVDDRAGPILGIPLSIEVVGSTVRLSAFGRPLCPIEDQDADGHRRKTAAKMIHRRLEQLKQEYQAERYHIRDLLFAGRLSCLAEQVLRGGGQAVPFFSQTIDLTLSDHEIRADLRDSLRNLLSRRRRDLVVTLVTSDNVTAGHRDTLRELHLRQYGRELQTDAGWEALRHAVAGGSAFFLFGSIDGEYACGAYFSYSSKYCHYSIAANDPTRYGAGLSYLLLWRAIEHSRDLGCRLFEVGDRIYPGQHDHVAAKFHAISHFKAGFGSRVATRLDVFSKA